MEEPYRILGVSPDASDSCRAPGMILHKLFTEPALDNHSLSAV